LTFDWI